MRLKSLELSGFKSFAKKTAFVFHSPVTSIVGPNGSGKSNCAEAFRWVLGERSMKSLRSGRGEDLIWNGSTHSPRTNRATVVLVFDNQDRKFDLDYDEVSIGREVHRDGVNIYTINGSQVRHRDIVELLAVVSLGSSDHYIVNQGDADRVLLANAKERRGMIEDALGLRLYQWKIEESEKKLQKTEENMKQVESLRREIAPHLRYLKKQVDKIAEADRLRRELKTLAIEYLQREETYLARRREELTQAKTEPEAKVQEIDERLAGLASTGSVTEQDAAPLQARQQAAEGRIDQARRQQEELGRHLGRLEGLIEVRQSALDEVNNKTEQDFSYQEVDDFGNRLVVELGAAEQETDLGALKNILNKIRGLVDEFLHRGDSNGAGEAHQGELEKLKQEKQAADESLARAQEEELAAKAEREEAAAALVALSMAAQSADKERLLLKAEVSEWQSKLNIAKADWRQFELEEENFKRELDEAVGLVDQEIRRYQHFPTSDVSESEPRAKQEERRRQLERLKIKLEDTGVESDDTLKEYQETTERDEFLAKELADLEQGATSLGQVVKDLQKKIDTDFKAGINQINDKFQKFFALMFGGGSAKLALLKLKSKGELIAEELGEDGDGLPAVGDGGDDEAAEGIEISVSLPRKKIRGLEMLSGGERALTSIALLFAMSQVNPPPFLILDETDAALDEANSRKYGDMVESLAKHSQLILITHNRETMSRAGVLYGVTMGADSASKLLSIKFDEATTYAK
ncbi:MAG: hypothetical protein U9M92_00530 [Patescibacteria group bacterium]|nr:hypothetical protein [Patescibacteria group bacterium]